MLSARKSSGCNNLKFPAYIPEFLCLLLFTCSSCLWVISLSDKKNDDAQLGPLVALERLIPQHEVQLLNANFSDQLHYDQLAQLQSEVEALIYEADVNEASRQLLKDYEETSLSYTQLTSMLKTSQRLISEDSRLEDTQLMEVINSIRLEMFSFISAPDERNKAALIELLNSINTDNKEQANWQHLQLVKLHSLFVLDNYELSATYRQKVIGMPVTEAIAGERVLLQQQIRTTAIKRFIGIFGTILALGLLLVVVVRRHQQALIKTSELHKEFATSVLDMLGPHGVEVSANLAHGGDGRKKPTQATGRKAKG